jgi:hypothetical protein
LLFLSFCLSFFLSFFSFFLVIQNHTNFTYFYLKETNHPKLTSDWGCSAPKLILQANQSPTNVRVVASVTQRLRQIQNTWNESLTRKSYTVAMLWKYLTWHQNDIALFLPSSQ